jgi:hypothetical protein
MLPATEFSKTFGGVMVKAAAHGISQGTLAMMQNNGAGFLSGAAGGFFGSLGATAWGGAGGEWKGIAGKYANSDVGTIAFGALSGGVGAELSGGNFWQGAITGGIVAGLNDVMHSGDDGIDPPKKKGKTVKQKTMPQKLHDMFDSIEEVGGWMEVGGLVAAPSTEGTSLGVTMVGVYFSAVGTAGNILVDGYQYLYTKNTMYIKSATFRGVKAIATAGMGKAIDRIPGGQYMTDKIILKAQVFVYEKLFSPVVQQRLILPTKN